VHPLLEGFPPHDVERLERVNCLGAASAVTPLDGGITNRNYRISTPYGDFVVRLSDPESSVLAIDRHNEYLNSCSAAASSAAPPVEQYIPGAGVLVVHWIWGRTFSAEDVREPHNLPRIAEACRMLHGGESFASDFDMFDIQARYLALVRSEGYRLPARYDEFESHVTRLHAAMQQQPEPLVPCNNDLLAGNIIDDGDRLWLIDYEYSGNNEASFELGNIWSESTLPEHLLAPLVHSYWGRESEQKVARARAWAVMSQYGWTLWAAIQDAISPIDFDYWSWGMEKYDRAVQTFDSPEFGRMLDAIARP
jgi:thiamine kinase-like enzyme